MKFNSIDFALFLPLVFLLYWFATNRKLKVQNLLLVVASYVFYGWWDWRFLLLMAFSTIVDYSVGIGLSNSSSPSKRKALLWVSIFANLSLLGFFKYYNFFLESFTGAFSFFGASIQANTLEIVLPVGISFYTFQTLSYSIDVYKRKLEPTKDFIAFAGFVCFFPQLVAGPIERAKDLLPQFIKKRTFSYQHATDGLRQMLWGFFKKMVIADNCGEYVNHIFANYSEMNGSTLAAGAFLFSIQVYGDFSGYSDIAIGSARLFGFKLKQNFAFPYFSRNIDEMWNRWHISLTNWFRDYLYFPLGGSRGSTWVRVRNTFIIFIVSGLWHGANWTFISWGFLHAILLLLVFFIGQKQRYEGVVAQDSFFPSVKEFFLMGRTFLVWMLVTIFFRAESMSQALGYFKGLFSTTLFQKPQLEGGMEFKILLLLIIFCFSLEWIGRKTQHALESFALNWPRVIRWAFYAALVIISMIFVGQEQQFIYFQF